MCVCYYILVYNLVCPAAPVNFVERWPTTPGRRVACKDITMCTRHATDDDEAEEMGSDDLRELVFEEIESGFYRAKYFEFDLILDDRGYVNVTKLCSTNKRKYKSWVISASAKTVTKELSKSCPNWNSVVKGKFFKY